MIEVEILARNWGDKSGQMTVQEFQSTFERIKQKGSWAIFAQDTAQPEGAIRVRADEVKDGMKISVVPQLAGG